MTRHTIPRLIFAGLMLAAAVGGASAARAEVRVNINLGAPPQLVPVPAAPNVAYAPRVEANYFSYGGQYYVFDNGAWHVSRGYNGPWVVVAPEYVPRPLLSVPVQYYRHTPRAWRQWQRAQAPRWERQWGQRWEERRYEGQASPRDRDRGRGHDRDDGRDRHDDRR